MINVTRFDNGSARDLGDAAKLRLLAEYFSVQDAVIGSKEEPEVQRDLLRMADRMEDLKVIAMWVRGLQDTRGYPWSAGISHVPVSQQLAEVLQRIAEQGAVK